MPKINGHPLPWNTNDDTAAMRVLLRLAVQMGPSHSEEAESWLGSFKFRQAIWSSQLESMLRRQKYSEAIRAKNNAINRAGCSKGRQEVAGQPVGLPHP
jgi:hypothetical protein